MTPLSTSFRYMVPELTSLRMLWSTCCNNSGRPWCSMKYSSCCSIGSWRMKQQCELFLMCLWPQFWSRVGCPSPPQTSNCLHCFSRQTYWILKLVFRESYFDINVNGLASFLMEWWVAILSILRWPAKATLVKEFPR
jgi:hypothetical protein